MTMPGIVRTGLHVTSITPLEPLARMEGHQAPGMALMHLPMRAKLVRGNASVRRGPAMGVLVEAMLVEALRTAAKEVRSAFCTACCA
jgi:hypothetical protein